MSAATGIIAGVTLCEVCQSVERRLFCAPYAREDEDEDERTGWAGIRHHKSLHDLDVSSTSGCGLCTLLLSGFLDTQLRYNGLACPNTAVLKAKLLDRESSRLPVLLRDNPIRARADGFRLRLSDDTYKVPGAEGEQIVLTGYTCVEFGRCWFHDEELWGLDANFLIVSEKGKSVSPCHMT